jgi:hypothetical protein
VDDAVDAVQTVEDLGPQQTVRIGEEAENHEESVRDPRSGVQ